jgi:3-oxoacyl-[acyl-carrier-protein] synthase II
MKAGTSQRVVVTGMGIITAIGESLPEFSRGLFDGRCGIGPVTLFDTTGFTARVGGQIQNEDLAASFNPREVKRASRCDLLGLIAAREALQHAALELERLDLSQCGVVLGGGAGGMLGWERYRRSLWRGRQVSAPSQVMACAPCTLTDLIAVRYGLTGIRATITTACSSSATSIGYGFDLIRSGEQQVVFVGGSESLSEVTFSGFNALRVMSPEGCRPFDRHRRGLSLGEGAAILILEAFEQARKRGATMYAEVLGYAINSDAYHMTSPDPEARGMRRVMTRALKQAQVTADRIDYINAHGTGTRINDSMETTAIQRVFGTNPRQRPAVSSTKSMVGHCLGAAGAIEAVATVLALHKQVIPPTIHLTEPDPACGLDHVAQNARPQKIRRALSNSFAFGGNNSTLVLGWVG